MLSDEWQIVETMVVDEREPIKNDVIKQYENIINKNRARRLGEVISYFHTFIEPNIFLDFPFTWFDHGISDYLAVSDEFEQLPNIEVIKHWKYTKIDDYELFAYEWITHKRSLPLQIIDLMKNSQITTICHLLAKAYTSYYDGDAFLPLIHSYLPFHTDELVRYDMNGKRPIDLLARDSPPAVKSLFEPD